jgi:6-phosphogluconolactonase
MSEPMIVVALSAQDLAETAARQFVSVVQHSQSESGRASVALSGGSTPRALFNLLANQPYTSQIDWTDVDIFWGDERTVPPDHPDSNYRMAKETLLSKLPIADDRVHRMRGELDPREAAVDYERELRQVFGDVSADRPPEFDLILLGIGSDGHTASCFPETEAVWVRDKLVVANPVPQQQTTRLTLSVPVLLAARNVFFLVAGADKAQAVHRAIEGDWNPNETPSQFLRDARGRVIWMLDTAAASELATGRDG